MSSEQATKQPVIFHSSAPRGVPPAHAVQKSYRVAQDGQDLGEMPVFKIKQLLVGGQLSLEDCYFDPEANDWLQFESAPSQLYQRLTSGHRKA